MRALQLPKDIHTFIWRQTALQLDGRQESHRWDENSGGGYGIMFLERIDISRFRGIYQLSLRLDKTTVLIGENNTGKSTILDAVQAALGSVTGQGKNTFGEYDHHLPSRDSRAANSDPIEITLRFAEQPGEEWPDTVVQRLRDVIQSDDDGRQSVTMRVHVKHNDATNESVPEWIFVNLQGDRLGVNAQSYRRALQSLVRPYFLKSIRDSEREFHPNSKFWRPFVRSMKMDPDLRKGLERELANLNQKILNAHGSFDVVENQLGNVAKMIPLDSGDPVSIEALPSKISDILSRTQVTLTSAAGAKIPIGRHGEGTQSLAVISLFMAFLHSNLDGDSTVQPASLLTIEEPEAHLHPSAAYSVIDMLQNPHGQNIVATHSGDLVSKIQISSLRRLHRKDGIIALYQVNGNAFSPKDKRAIDYQIHSTRGNLLFARCWLLVEGETDHLVIEGCAFACNIDLIRKGIYCVEYRQSDPQVLIRLAKQLGIEWLVAADGDRSGNETVRSTKKELGGEAEDRHIYQLEDVLDVLLCMNGYGQFYEGNCKHPVQTTLKDLSYWKDVVKDQRSKPATAALVIEEIERKGEVGVPSQIREIIGKAIDLAEGTQ